MRENWIKAAEATERARASLLGAIGALTDEYRNTPKNVMQEQVAENALDMMHHVDDVLARFIEAAKEAQLLSDRLSTVVDTETGETNE